jgi:hypothetical protein
VRGHRPQSRAARALSAKLRDGIYHDREPEALTRSVFVAPLERLLLHGAADCSLAAVADTAEAATLLFNAVTHTYAHLGSGHRWATELARERMVGLVINGVAGHESGRWERLTVGLRRLIYG